MSPSKELSSRTPGRIMLLTVAPVAVAAMLFTASCSSDASTSASTTTSAPATTSSATTSSSAPTSASNLSAEDQQAITTAFTTFFDGATPAATKLQYVQNPDSFSATIDAQAGSGLATTTTATVSGVLGTGPEQASVTYTILMSGQPVLPDQTGVAVKENGQWKVAAATFCDLLTLQNGGVAPAECVGVQLPGVSAEPTTGAATTS